MDRASRVQVRGSLAAYAPGFRARLSGLGYAPPSAGAHLGLMAQLSRWVDETETEVSELTAERIEEFLGANRARGHRFPKSFRGAEPLVSFLRSVEVIPPAAMPVLGPIDQLLERFGGHLASERGLGRGTITHQVYAARLFLHSVEPAVLRDLGRLDASHVRRFMLAESRRRSGASAKCLVTGLRSLMRFLHVEGITDVSLAGAVPTVSGWANTWLPRGVDPGSVRRLVAGCDRNSPKGRRDHAVLMLLTRLGMRVGEVAALRIDDIDWHAGELLVRGKSQRLERLPLPSDVGQALAVYIRTARPSSEHRELFLRVLAPHRGLTSGGVIMVVRAACRRQGLDPIAAHRLRHTVASDLLRAGAGLPEIGQLLRHRSMASTAIYAKVDTANLRELARPWPGGVA